MTELIFILIAIALYITVRLLPSYTPEQVGSNKLIVRRQSMNTTENTIPVAVFKCTQEQAWYENLPKPMLLVVQDSGTPGDFRIAHGEYAGNHIAKDDCTEALGNIDTEARV